MSKKIPWTVCLPDDVPPDGYLMRRRMMSESDFREEYCNSTCTSSTATPYENADIVFEMKRSFGKIGRMTMNRPDVILLMAGTWSKILNHSDKIECTANGSLIGIPVHIAYSRDEFRQIKLDLQHNKNLKVCTIEEDDIGLNVKLFHASQPGPWPSPHRGFLINFVRGRRWV